MKAGDRVRLTGALREHVARIAEDLRHRMRTEPVIRARAERLHADERVGEDFDVWTDLLSRRAAVLWVLKSVYVRVLEDLGLLSPGRLVDPEAQELFERLAPNLGESAFLRWVYRDLASPRGGLPELFGEQPAEVAAPADALSRELIRFWRHRDPDTGQRWSFAGERFEGELMGDLYQELDPVVKARFALCQTPVFVRTFMLDRTLTPALETFGADTVRLLDPACGSGHFLIDGLKRLVAATAAAHPDWDRLQCVTHGLDRVVGIDLNDYACALARARLIMTAAELAGVQTLAEAARFHPHVYWADGLEQVEKDESHQVQLDLFETVVEKPRAVLTRSDVRDALRRVFAKKFHTVVANPPYILERDEARKAYHRELIGKKRRYVSATGKYSLGSPFTERCFQLAEPGGFVGLITSNNFMKREFGKALIEQVLPAVDLTLVADTSQAYIPFHGTPTVLVFGRNRPPAAPAVRAVLGKRGESGTPADPAQGRVWRSLVEGWQTPGFENEYVSVTDLSRETLGKHPWSLGGGGAAELKEIIENKCASVLGKVATSIGYTTICGEDPVYLANACEHERTGVISLSAPLVAGDSLRDWSFSAGDQVIFPYESFTGPALPSNHPFIEKAFWRFRQLLRSRLIFQQTLEQKGMQWFEHMYRDVAKLSTPLSIAFAFVATHNHFVLDRGGKVFNRSAPVIKLPAGATEDDHLALLGLLNSSTACFWMKQVFHNKRGSGDGKGMRESWMDRFEFDSTKMQAFPVVEAPEVLAYARALDACAVKRNTTAAVVLENLLSQSKIDAVELATALAQWRAQDWILFQTMVALQEELDWVVYRAYGLFQSEVVAPEEVGKLIPGQRPFEIEFDQANRADSEENASLRTDWFSLQGWDFPDPQWPNSIEGDPTRHVKRLQALREVPELRLLETPDYKRRWYRPDYEAQEQEALATWLAGRVEEAVKERTAALTVDQVAARLQADPRVLAVCEVLTGRRDFSLTRLVADTLEEHAVPSCVFHVYKPSGLVKRQAWERTWEDQRREDAGEAVTPAVPPAYLPADFLKPSYWRLRGKLDVPRERFIAFSEIPGRGPGQTLYGWAGWTPVQRIRVMLALDEGLEDAGVPLSERIALLDGAWRLLPDASREDAATAARLKAELQALVGTDGPGADQLEKWRAQFVQPPGRGRTRQGGPRGARRDDPADQEES